MLYHTMVTPIGGQLDEFQAKAIDNGLIIASADRYVVEARRKNKCFVQKQLPLTERQAVAER